MSKNYLPSKLINVMVIENEEKVLQMTKSYFLSNDTNIIIVKTIDDAKFKLKKTNVDCIIIDTTMCTTDSDDFIQNLKANQKLQHIPFIILTPKGFVKDRIKGYTSGCSAYLSKPFDPMELKVIVKNIVSQKNLLTQDLISSYFLIKKLRFNMLKKYRHFCKESRYITLTPKEEIILNYLLKNIRGKNISEKLKINIRTVEKSVSKILDKTQTKNKKELRILPWNIMF